MPDSCGHSTSRATQLLSQTWRTGTSPVVQRLGLRVHNAGDQRSIPGQGTRFHMPQLRSSTLKQTNITKPANNMTYSLVRVGADESKQLPQQHAVGGLVPAVLYGQWLQEREGAAAVAGHVAPPTAKQETRSGGVLRRCVAACGDQTLALSYLPLICSSKFQIFITDHFQVRRSRHAAKENRLPHSMRDHLCFRGWFTSWNRKEEEGWRICYPISKNDTATAKTNKESPN